jgi:protein-L-isoaspartate(D-aspartate) O-methyltransferase
MGSFEFVRPILPNPPGNTDPAKFLSILVIAFFLIINSAPNILSQEIEKDEFVREREDMVKYQIQNRGISDSSLLNAMRTVPRHKFVLKPYRSQAYIDSPLPIGDGQTISQPYIVAFMTEILELKRYHKVLEIGTGSGYQAVILAELSASVFTIEIFESLGNKAARLFEELDYNNIHVKVGDGYKGWIEHAPFDRIIVTCAPTHVPESLQEQLVEGGMMIIPTGGHSAQSLILLIKKEGKLIRENVLPVRFVPMIDEGGKKY